MSRLDHQLRNGRCIAQAEIEPLCADRRDDMRGFADQRDACLPEALRCFDGERKQPSPFLDRHFAEDRVRTTFDFGGERRCIEGAKLLGLFGTEHADQTRAQAGQGNERERPGFGVKFGRNAVMRARVSQVQSQGHLWIFMPPRLDPGSLAAERLAPIGTDNETRAEQPAIIKPDRDRIVT
jgi:hypothetical protein